MRKDVLERELLIASEAARRMMVALELASRELQRLRESATEVCTKGSDPETGRKEKEGAAQPSLPIQGVF